MNHFKCDLQKSCKLLLILDDCFDMWLTKESEIIKCENQSLGLRKLGFLYLSKFSEICKWLHIWGGAVNIAWRHMF